MGIVVLGAGAVGSIIAGHLARAGEDVVVVARGDRAGYLRQRETTDLSPTSRLHRRVWGILDFGGINATRVAGQGYVVIAQDTRSRFSSESAWEPTVCRMHGAAIFARGEGCFHG